MTETELVEKLSSVVSRGIIVHGFGMVDLFVPVKSVGKIKLWVVDVIPAEVWVEVKPLKLSMKKGVKVYKVKDLHKDVSNKLYSRKWEV